MNCLARAGRASFFGVVDELSSTSFLADREREKTHAACLCNIAPHDMCVKPSPFCVCVCVSSFFWWLLETIITITAGGYQQSTGKEKKNFSGCRRFLG